MLNQRIMFRPGLLMIASTALLFTAASADATLVIHFDPNDLSTQFSDGSTTGGTVPAAIGDPAGFVTDVRSPTPGAPQDTFIDGENNNAPTIVAHSSQGSVWDFASNNLLIRESNSGDADGFGTTFDGTEMTAIIVGRASSEGDGTRYFFDFRDDAGDLNNEPLGFGLRYDHNTGLLEGLAKQAVNTSVALPVGEWFVATYAWNGGAGAASLNVETVSGLSLSDSGAAETVAIQPDTLRLGTSTSGSSSSRLFGQMGDVMVYNDVADHSAVAAQLALDYLNIPELLIDRSTGNISITNSSGTDVTNVIGYTMTSTSGTLDPSQWLSITENYDAGNVGPDQVDPDNNWTELTDSASTTDLSEIEFESNGGANNGADFLDGTSTDLGNAWVQYYGEDVAMELLLDNGDIVPLDVRFTGNGGASFQYGDLDFDGDVDADDFYNEFLPNYGDDTSGLDSGAARYALGDMDEDGAITLEDFIRLNNAYTAANPGGAALSFSTVPEPSSLLLLTMAAGIVFCRRRNA